MNARELRKYQRDLTKFMDRGTQFVAGYMRKPIPRRQWLSYKQEEQRANTRLEHFYARIKAIQLPGRYESFNVADYRAMRKPVHPHMQNPSANTPGSLNRSPRSFEYESKLRQMTDELKKKGSDKWWQDKINQGREQYGMMTEAMGRMDLFERVMELSDDQFALLFFYTPFMDNASLTYETAMKAYDHTQRPWLDQAANEKDRENEMWIKWASEQNF